jgi:hypothetical protein
MEKRDYSLLPVACRVQNAIKKAPHKIEELF